MRWQPTLIDCLGRVRDVRMRLAEIKVARAEEQLAVCREAEQRAREEVDATIQRSEVEIAQANEELLLRRTGGRHGITNWHAVRTRAKAAVRSAQGNADEAASARLGQELTCSTERKQWQQVRLAVERMKLLVEGMEGPSR